MNWQDFEKLIKKIFEHNGYKVDRVGGSGADGGIDLIVKKKMKTSMVQCKKYKSNVGVKVIREMYAVGIHHKFNHVYIYTTAKYTKEAISFAKGKNMTLIDGNQLLEEIKRIS